MITDVTDEMSAICVDETIASANTHLSNDDVNEAHNHAVIDLTTFTG